MKQRSNMHQTVHIEPNDLSHVTLYNSSILFYRTYNSCFLSAPTPVCLELYLNITSVQNWFIHIWKDRYPMHDKSEKQWFSHIFPFLSDFHYLLQCLTFLWHKDGYFLTYTFIRFWETFLPTWLLGTACLLILGSFSYLHHYLDCTIIPH